MNAAEARAALVARATALGFARVGFAAATNLDEDVARLRAWLTAGNHGDMAWLAREPERRGDPRLVLGECRTVVVLTMRYLREPVADDAGPPPAGTGRISRYARTRDYHRVIEKRLRKLARLIDEQLAPGARSRGLVDYGPAMERPWAVRAGLGFVGKHTLHIDPQTGSFHFLAVLLTTADLASGLAAHDPVREGCGDCRRCIDACPTGAITEPWKLDARRCLSYLTIEKQGPIDPELWPHFEGWLFGCDICQEVCPYNRTRARPVGEDSALGPELVPGRVDLAALLRDPGGFLAPLAGDSSPLKRAGAESLRRNAAILARHDPTPESTAAAADALQQPDLPSWLRELLES